MAATEDRSPGHTASQINTILAKTVANMTLADLIFITEAIDRGAGNKNSKTATIGSLFH